jgi:Spy/CpxP family protein refolding chaperone
MTTHTFFFAIVCALAITQCAKRELPGDSVSSDGAVTLSPPAFTTTPELANATPDAPRGAIENKLYPPELVMEHQAALAIDPAQRDAILKEVDRGQAEIAHLEWDLQGEKEKLVKVLDSDRVDEDKAKEEATRVMELEDRVKSAHLVMLVRVKNILTPAQQKTLRDLRDAPKKDAPQKDGAP